MKISLKTDNWQYLTGDDIKYMWSRYATRMNIIFIFNTITFIGLKHWIGLIFNSLGILISTLVILSYNKFLKKTNPQAYKNAHPLKTKIKRRLKIK